jgi:hypothetical protein
MKRLFLIIFCVALSFQNLTSQTYRDVFSEFFFDRLPSAKIESMGKIRSVSTESFFVSQANPAMLIQGEGINAFYSQSSPFYLAKDYKFHFSGISYKYSNIDAFALNLSWLDAGNMHFSDPFGNSKVAKVSQKILTLSYARDIIGIIKLGINANLFIDDFNPDKTVSGSFFDIGFLKDIYLIKNNIYEDKVLIGLLFKNIFNQGIINNGLFARSNDKYYFPSILSIGISNVVNFYNQDIYNQSHFIGLTTDYEYQNVINYKYRTATKIGFELSLLNILFARCGYYSETQFKASNGKGSLTDFTYGFGLNLEWSKLLNTESPLTITFDYTSLKQPTYIVNFDDWDNFTIYSIRLNYLFE